MKVTITDIAKAAGVAKSTVSKVLNDSPRISEDTKQRVREIMKEMNYTPSSIATGLARQSSQTVALLIDMSKESEFLNQYFYNIIGGIESVIGTRKYELTIANVQHNHPEGHFLQRLVLNKRVDGLIANTSVLSEALCEELHRLRFPYISIGEIQAPGSWVDFDNRSGGKMLTAHLLAQGYASVAFVGGVDGETIREQRYAGYRKALEQAGRPLNEAWVHCGEAHEDEGYRAAMLLLQSGRPPEAIVCINNYIAYGVLKAAGELGVRIPQQLGIATFDDYPLSRYMTPPLTSLNIDTFRLGVAAGKLLMEQLGNPDTPAKHLLLKPELIARESTARR